VKSAERVAMKILLAALLSVAIFQAVPHKDTPVNNLEAKVAITKPAEQPPPIKSEIPAQEVAPVETPAIVPEVETPAPQPEVSHPTGCENYRQLLSQYDWNVNVMSAICHAESRGNPSAIGDNYVIGGVYAPSCGLFQVRTLSSRPSCEALKDPATNIAWAYRIYQGQGFSAWSVCSYKVSCG
jgi:hypothetical protein